MSTLARQHIGNGTAPTRTLDAAYRVSTDEFLLVYTVSEVVYADIFKVPSVDDQTVLEQGAGGGETLTAVLAAGSSDLTAQPIVTSALVVTA